MTLTKSIPEVSLLKFLRHSANILKNPLPFHHKNFQEKGDTFRLNIGFNKSVLFSRDARLAEYVLQKNHKNYTKTKIQTEDLAKYLGKGLLTSEGKRWKDQRKLIQPAFHKANLSKLLHAIKEAIIAEFKSIKPNRPLDVFPIFNDLAFQTVVKSLFSSAVDSDQIKRLQFITEESQKMLVRELRQPYLTFWFKASGAIQKHLDLTAESRQILNNLIQERKDSRTKYDDLLDMLLESTYDDGAFMEEEQLIDEILVLFTAGHETTSNALSFICQLLAKHPEWQERIYQEIESLKTDDLMEFVSSCKITQQVIEEAMRLYPPAYFMDRENLEEDNFKGMTFKTGTNILFSIYEIHRHPKLWDAPEDFRPDRFKDGGKQFSSQYFPFGAGPRKCIGNNFAMFEMVLAITELIANYKIEPCFNQIEIHPLITLKPKNAILKAVPR